GRTRRVAAAAYPGAGSPPRVGCRQREGGCNMTVRYIVADVFDGLATLEDGSVDLVVTSPPFGWVRSYLPADHPDKAKEIGHEANPAEYIDTLLAVTDRKSTRLNSSHVK